MIGRLCLNIHTPYHHAFLKGICIDNNHDNQHHSSTCFDASDMGTYAQFVSVYHTVSGLAISTQFKGYHDSGISESQWFTPPPDAMDSEGKTVYTFAPPLGKDDIHYCMPIRHGASSFIRWMLFIMYTTFFIG
jgi:hypothetical protein